MITLPSVQSVDSCSSRWLASILSLTPTIESSPRKWMAVYPHILWFGGFINVVTNKLKRFTLAAGLESWLAEWMSGSSSWGGCVDVTKKMVVIGECVDATGLETAVVEGLEFEVVLPSGKLLSGTSVSTLCCGLQVRKSPIVLTHIQRQT